MSALAERLRQLQASGSRSVPALVNRERLRTLEFSNAKVVRSVHAGGVAALDLDAVDQRYLLAGAGDASIAIYDTQQPSSEEAQAQQETAREAAGAEASLARNAPALRASGQAGAARSNAEHTEHAALLTIGKQAPQAHKFSVSAVAWYPVDSGLFVSGGYDSEVKVWDTNTAAVVCSFTQAARVYAAAMSPVAASHCLVAVGSADTQVQLCDIVSGGFTHTLAGHRAAVWALAWSPSIEWQLVTGGCDGQLRLWDIRRPGPLHIFDQHDTLERRQQQRQQQQQQEAAEEPAGGRRQDAQQPAARSIQRRGSGSKDGSSSSSGRRRSASHGRQAGGGKAGARQQAGLQRSSSGGGGLGGAAGEAGSSERMFLPERVTKYSTGHAGSITGVVPTPDGLHWLSAGTDDRVRLWDTATRSHALVHYPGAFNRANRARQLSVSDDSSTLFHPSGSVIQLFDVPTGRMVRALGGGHFDTINCCKWNPAAQELYSGGDDCNIVVWAPAPERTTAEREDWQAGGSDGDAWSE